MSVARDIQQICCSTQTGQHSPLQGSCCPVWALQHIHTRLQLHTYSRPLLYNPIHTYTVTCTCPWALYFSRGCGLEPGNNYILELVCHFAEQCMWHQVSWSINTHASENSSFADNLATNQLKHCSCSTAQSRADNTLGYT